MMTLVNERNDMEGLLKKVALEERAYAEEWENLKGSLEKTLNSIKDLE